MADEKPVRPASGPVNEVAGRPLQAGGFPGSAGETHPGDPPGAAARLFRRYIDLENNRDYDAIDQLLHSTEMVCHPWFGNQPVRPQAITRMLRGLFAAFPDWQMEINEIIVATDEVCVGKITGRGTQVSTWMNRPPSDQQIAIPLIHCINVRDGHIVRYSSTVPWRVPHESDFVTAGDVQAAEATQGVEVARTERALRAAVEEGVLDRAAMQELTAELAAAQNQCQELLESNMRRCSKQASPNSAYCDWHNEHGYGIDTVESRTRTGS